MSWIRAAGQNSREVWVRKNDIAEVEFAGNEALIRRRGHPQQYPVKNETEIEKLEELVTTDDPPPQTVNVSVASPPIDLRGLEELVAKASSPPVIPESAAPPPPPLAGALKVLEILAEAPHWRPQLRNRLIAGGLTAAQAGSCVRVAMIQGLIVDQSDLLSITPKGRDEFQKATKQ